MFLYLNILFNFLLLIIFNLCKKFSFYKTFIIIKGKIIMFFIFIGFFMILIEQVLF